MKVVVMSQAVKFVPRRHTRHLDGYQPPLFDERAKMPVDRGYPDRSQLHRRSALHFRGVQRPPCFEKGLSHGFALSCVSDHCAPMLGRGMVARRPGVLRPELSYNQH